MARNFDFLKLRGSRLGDLQSFDNPSSVNSERQTIAGQVEYWPLVRRATLDNSKLAKNLFQMNYWDGSLTYDGLLLHTGRWLTNLPPTAIGRVVRGQSSVYTTAPLRNLPLDCRDGECLLWARSRPTMLIGTRYDQSHLASQDIRRVVLIPCRLIPDGSESRRTSSPWMSQARPRSTAPHFPGPIMPPTQAQAV